MVTERRVQEDDPEREPAEEVRDAVADPIATFEGLRLEAEEREDEIHPESHGDSTEEREDGEDGVEGEPDEGPTTAQAMVATAARAPSISRRMKPTSSKSGATHAGVSSLRFRRAIGRSEAGGASKTFAQSRHELQIARRETHILQSGPTLRNRLEDVKGPAMVSDLVTDRQFAPLEPPRLRKRVRSLESRHAVEIELVVERHVPCAAVPLERFDVIEPRFQTGQAELLFQEPRPGALGMLKIGHLIVGQEPSALVVILRHVAVPDEQHLALREKRDVGDQCVNPALGFQ